MKKYPPHYHREDKEDLSPRAYFFFILILFIAGVAILYGVWQTGKEFLALQQIAEIQKGPNFR